MPMMVMRGVLVWGVLGAVLGLEHIEGYQTQFEVVKTGNSKGYVVSRGDRVSVHATGMFKETGKKFFSTKVR